MAERPCLSWTIVCVGQTPSRPDQRVTRRTLQHVQPGQKPLSV